MERIVTCNVFAVGMTTFTFLFLSVEKLLFLTRFHYHFKHTEQLLRQRTRNRNQSHNLLKSETVQNVGVLSTAALCAKGIIQQDRCGLIPVANERNGSGRIVPEEAEVAAGAEEDV